MATLAGESSPSPTLSGTGSMDEPSSSVNMRKRPRETFDDSFDDGQWDLTDDGRPKTRRVNPQRLAIRLGPDLVAEMEALIVPGAKMPTFTVRKDFQERYNVDRRHIYDYFHSRGLRVAKEDKHTNLIRGRAMKAQAQAQAQAQLQALSQSPSSPTVKQEPQVGEIVLTSPFLAETAKSPVEPRGRAIKRSLKTQDKKLRIATMRRPGRLPKVLKAERDNSELLVTPPSSANTPEIVPAMASSGTDTEWEATTPVCPRFSPSDDHIGIKIKETSDVPDFLPSPDDYVAGYFESPLDDTQQPFLDIESNLTCDSMDLNSLMTADEHRLLTPEERNELYDLIASNIPRANGFEESALTYNDYMNDHLPPYFDSLPANYYTSTRSNWKSAASTSTYSSPAIDSPISVDIPDLRKWLSDDLDVYLPSVNIDEYNPTIDEMDDSHALTEMNSREPFAMASVQLQNRLVSGKLQKPIDHTNKQGFQYQDENVRPCGT